MRTRFVIFAALLLVGCTDKGECLAHHYQPIITMAGKVPIVTMVRICDRWEFPEGKP